MSLIGRSFYSFDGFELQPAARTLTRLGERVQLAPKTFEVLLCLVERAGRVVTKDELLKAVWPESFVEESNLTQHVFNLRKALGDGAGCIATVPGRGYQFTAKVAVVGEEEEMALQQVSGPGVRIQHSIERTHVVVEETAATSLPLSARRWFWPGLAAVGVIVVGLTAWGLRWWNHRVVPGDHHEVVVADFQNSTGDPDFDKALRTLLVIDLNDSPTLQVASEGDTKKMLKLMNRDPESEMPAAVAREVCERMNDQVVVSGLIARFGQKYLVTLEATDCTGGKALVQTKAVATSRDDVIHAVDSVAADMRERLGEPLATLKPGQRLSVQHTFSLDALRAFSAAQEVQYHGKFKDAVPLYERAITLDPNFATAYAELSFCYLNIGEGHKAKDLMAKAYELRDLADGPERQRIIVFYEYNQTGDRHAAIRAYQNWANTYPLQAYPFGMLGTFQAWVGPLSEAVSNEKRYVELAPNGPAGYIHLASYQVYSGDLEGAKATCRLGAARGQDTFNLHTILRDIAFLQHDKAAYDEQWAWLEKNADADYLEGASADLDLSEGKYKSAIAHAMREADIETRNGQTHAATDNLSAFLELEAEAGMQKEATALLPHFSSNLPTSPQAWSNVIVAAAEVGQPDLAEKMLTDLKARAPHSSDIQEIYSGEDQAAIDLARGQPLAAIEALKLAEPYEASTSEVPMMRGKVYLAAKMPELAQREYLYEIEHPFNDAISMQVPLAHLGVARALVMEGNKPAAKLEYGTFFGLWKDADADLPILKQAHAEYDSMVSKH